MSSITTFKLTCFDTRIKCFFTDVIKKLDFFRPLHIPLFFLFPSDKRLYSTSGGEVLFTKLDQEAEMDIKVTTTTKTQSVRAAPRLKGHLGDKRNKSKWHVHRPTARPVSYLRTQAYEPGSRGSHGLWAGSPSLGLIFIVQPSDLFTVNALIRAKHWNVHDYQSPQVVWLCA